MKTKLLLLLLTFSFYVGNTQCTTIATNFGNNTNPNYEVTGNVSVTLNSNNTVTLDLGSTFMTAPGPDVRAYLVNSNGLSNSQLQNTPIANLVNIEFGLVSCSECSPVIPSNGSKSFTANIPAGQDITNYDKVFFYCLQFNAFWDFGDFASFTNANCNVLSVNSNTILNTIDLYPNPAVNNILITNNKQLNIDIEIYNVLGNKVLETKKNTTKEQTINLSSLKSGVYLVQINTNGNSITKRLIKQ